MTRQEIEERAARIVDDVEGVNDRARSVTYTAEALVDLRRATLEEAARAVCWKCEEGEEVAPKVSAEWCHYDGEACRASEIHDLIAAMESEASNDQG